MYSQDLNSNLQSETLFSGCLEEMEELWVDSLEHGRYAGEVVWVGEDSFL